MKEELFFLPLFIKENIYIIDKEKHNTSLGTEETLLPNEIPQDIHTPKYEYLVIHQESSPLPTAQEQLLQNILKAISLSPNLVAITSLSEFQQIQLQDKKFIFVFTSAYHALPKLFSLLEKNKTRILTEGTKALLSDSLSTLTSDKQEKLALWAELKKAFDLK